MAATAQKLSPSEIAEAIEREPFVGTTVASRLLGIKASNFRRDASPKLIAIPVDGSASVYFRSEVERLAADWAASGRGRSNGDG